MTILSNTQSNNKGFRAYFEPQNKVKVFVLVGTILPPYYILFSMLHNSFYKIVLFYSTFIAITLLESCFAFGATKKIIRTGLPRDVLVSPYGVWSAFEGIKKYYYYMFLAIFTGLLLPAIGAAGSLSEAALLKIFGWSIFIITGATLLLAIAADFGIWVAIDVALKTTIRIHLLSYIPLIAILPWCYLNLYGPSPLIFFSKSYLMHCMLAVAYILFLHLAHYSFKEYMIFKYKNAVHDKIYLP